MPIEIEWLDDEPKQEVTPRAPAAARQTRPGPKVPPPPQGGSPVWYVCGNEGVCVKAGYIATGSGDPIVKQDRRKCRGCGGLGIDVETESPCERCGASGKEVVGEREVPPNVPCPYCKQQMLELQRGGYPAGYPRMETPHTDKDPEGGGNVSFGRHRTVS